MNNLIYLRNILNLRTIIILGLAFIWANDPPEITPIENKSTEEEVDLTLLIIASDIDGDNLSYSAVSSNDGVLISLDSNELTLSPILDWNGTVDVTVTVNDDGDPSLSAIETFELLVNPVNDAPVLTLIGSQSVDEDNELILTMSSSDIDGDNLSYSEF